MADKKPGDPGYRSSDEAETADGTKIEDVAPSIRQMGGGAWSTTVQKNATFIMTPAVKGKSRSVYQLIEFGPSGVIPDYGQISAPVEVQEELEGTGRGTPGSPLGSSTLPSEIGDSWTGIKEMKGNLTRSFQSKTFLALALLDFAGCVGWEWQKKETAAVGASTLETLQKSEAGGHNNVWRLGGRRLSLADMLNAPVGMVTNKGRPWSRVGYLGEKFAFNLYDIEAGWTEKSKSRRQEWNTKQGRRGWNRPEGDTSSTPSEARYADETVAKFSHAPKDKDLTKGTKITVQIMDLPFQGFFYNMTLFEFCEYSGIDIRTFDQGNNGSDIGDLHSAVGPEFLREGSHYLAKYDGTPTKTSLKSHDPETGSEEFGIYDPEFVFRPAAGYKNRSGRRGRATAVMLGMVPAKTVIAFNYFYLNENNAQKEFNKFSKLQALADAVDEAPPGSAEAQAATDAYKSSLRQMKSNCVNIGDQTAITRANATPADLIFSEKCVLAANIKFLARENQIKMFRTKKYKFIEMANGNPSEFINKLHMQEGFLEFAHDVNNLHLSHLLPYYRFFKVKYEDGCPETQIPIIFPQQADLTAMMESHGRGQVGVKNITWRYISDNVSTVRNDIEAEVTLFFQNFNALTECHTSAAGETWQYLDLLRRPPKDLEKILAQAAKARQKAKCASGALLTKSELNASQTTSSKKNPKPSEIEEAILSSKGALINPAAAFPEWHEIKLVVGWVKPNFLPDDPNDLIKKGVENNATPLFLTLIDHSFDIRQDGVFELTLTYRARIEGLLSDGRANILANAASRNARAKLDEQMRDAKQFCDEQMIETVKKQIKVHNGIQKAWMGDALLADLIKGKADFLKRTQIFTAIISSDEIVDAQFTNAPVTLSHKNTNVSFPNGNKNLDPVDFEGVARGQGSAKLAAKYTVAGIDRQNMGYVVATTTQTSEGETSNELLASSVATETATNAKYGDGDINKQYEARITQNTYPDFLDYQEKLKNNMETDIEEAKWNIWPFTKWNAEIVKELTTNNEATADTLELGRDKVREGRQFISYPIHFMYAGDLIENAAQHALGQTGGDPPINNPSSFAPCTVGDVKILLGPVELKDVDGVAYRINIADIPISLRAFGAWFEKNITNQDKSSYSLLQFIRDMVKIGLVDIFQSNCYDGAYRQTVALKTGILSVPKLENGSTPIQEKIDQSMPSWQKGNVVKTKLGVDYFAGKAGVPPWKYTDTAVNNILNLEYISNKRPLSIVNVWSPASELTHYVYVYGEHADPGRDLIGNFEKDKARGIYHLYMGHETGLVKSIKFTKTDQPYLREAKFEADSLNPLAELSSVYKADVGMVGNTMFYPGQYVFINMMPIGQDLGHPGDKDANDGRGSYANQLGLGGYHIITKVSNEITSDNLFETNLECLWDNSGDGRSRLSAGSQTKADLCPADTEPTPATPGPGGKGIEEAP